MREIQGIHFLIFVRLHCMGSKFPKIFKISMPSMDFDVSWRVLCCWSIKVFVLQFCHFIRFLWCDLNLMRDQHPGYNQLSNAVQYSKVNLQCFIFRFQFQALSVRDENFCCPSGPHYVLADLQQVDSSTVDMQLSCTFAIFHIGWRTCISLSCSVYWNLTHCVILDSTSLGTLPAHSP